MKNYYFLIMFFLSIISFGQGVRPFIIKVQAVANKLLIPATGSYLLTVKDSSGNVVNGLNQVSSSTLTLDTSSSGVGSPALYYHDLATGVTSGAIYTLEFLNEGTEGLRIHTTSLANEVRFYNSGEVKEIVQWGDVVWNNNMSRFMQGALNVILTAPDTPNFSNVTNMSYMFSGTEKFNGNVNTTNLVDVKNWDTSNVTDMSYMFDLAKIFNQDIGKWNTSKVTNMSYMFSGEFYKPSVFNQDISTKEVTVNDVNYTAWNTSNVTNMHGMFSYATEFDQPIGNWNTSAVLDMGGMFFGADIFNQPIGNWNTSKVTNMDGMFTFANNFNQDISTKIVTINSSNYTAWDTSNVTNMSRLFEGAKTFNQDISNWNTSKVTNMSKMFSTAEIFNKNISTKEVTVDGVTYTAWDTSKVTNMSFMFDLASQFNQPIGNWNTSAVLNMGGMFANTSFNQELSTKSVTINNSTYTAWDTSNVTDMSQMFQYTNKFNQDLSSWDVSKVKDFNRTFQGATVFTSDLSSWNIGSATDLSYMFYGASQFTSDLSDWNFNHVINYIPTTGLGFRGLYRMLDDSGLTCTDFSNILISWANNPIVRSKNFYLSITPINLRYNTAGQVAFNSLVNDYLWTIVGATYDPSCTSPKPFIIKIQKSEEGLFTPGYGLYKLTIKDENGNIVDNINQKSFNTTTDPSRILNDITQYPTITSSTNGTIFTLEFFNSTTTPLRITNYNTNNLPIVSASNIKEITQWGEILWNDNMAGFMINANNLIISATDKPNFSNVRDMSYMFYFNTALADIPRINEWDVSNVRDMSHVFHGADLFNSDISNWNTMEVNTMDSMFTNATEFDQYIGNWNTSNITNMTSMFNSAEKFNKNISTKEVTINGVTYTAWDTSNVTDMSLMFQGAFKFNGNISNWNTSLVEDFREIFSGALSFNQDISIREENGKKYWDISKANPTSNGKPSNRYYVNAMIDGSGLDCTNFSKAIISWDNFIEANINNPTIDIANYKFGSARNFDGSSRGFNSNASNAYTNLGDSRISNGVIDLTCSTQPETPCTNQPTIDANHQNNNTPSMVISTIKNQEKALSMQKNHNDSHNSFISLKKGFVLPRSSTDGNFDHPVDGLIYYDTSDSCIKMYKVNPDNPTQGTWSCLRSRCSFLINLDDDAQLQ